MVGFYAAKGFPGLQRTFTPRALLQFQVNREAKRAFEAFRLSKTRDATGIMLYVSIFEKMVVVIADKSINEKHDQATWDGVRNKLIAGLKNGKPGEGYESAISLCGEILTKDFPIKGDDTNELANHIRIL